MIFVPSAGGISHSAREYTAPAAIASGADVLLHTLLELDATLDRWSTGVRFAGRVAGYCVQFRARPRLIPDAGTACRWTERPPSLAAVDSRVLCRWQRGRAASDHGMAPRRTGGEHVMIPPEHSRTRQEAEQWTSNQCGERHACWWRRPGASRGSAGPCWRLSRAT